jgi:ribonuclease HI
MKNKNLFDKKIIEKSHLNSDLVCYSDGSGDNSSCENDISYGFVVYEKNNVIHSSKNTHKSNNNSTVKAEILGINDCLSFLLSENLQNENITFFCDNKWVVDWCCNKLTWTSKNYEAPYYSAYLSLREFITNFNKIQFIWIPREYNTFADSLLR